MGYETMVISKAIDSGQNWFAVKLKASHTKVKSSQSISYRSESRKLCLCMACLDAGCA